MSGWELFGVILLAFWGGYVTGTVSAEVRRK